MTGTLLGNVTDSSGGAVPGATVTATEIETNVEPDRRQQRGRPLHLLEPGERHLHRDRRAPGLQEVVRQNVKVDVNTTIRVDLALEVGPMTESVTVSAETPVLQTDRTDTGRIIESKMVTDLPLTFNRNFQSLLITVPGSTRPHREHSQFFNSQDSLRFEVNGQPGMASNTLIEGLDDNHKTGLLQVIIPAADALETVSVTTSNYDAEFGRSGGAITNVTIKSGTNDYKGSVFVFGNNEKTNASDYFTHQKAPTKFLNTGFTLGGPIVRNKLFFFGDYQRTLDNNGYIVRATVPTARSATATSAKSRRRIYDPLTGASTATGAHRVRRQHHSAEPHQPDRAEAARLHSRAQHCRRAARAEQLQQGPDAREDDRRLRRQGQSHDEPARSDVVPRQLHAPGRVRSGPVRAVRRAGQRRVRGRGHQHSSSTRRHLDARVQRQDRHGRSRRPELLPQRHDDDGPRPDDQHRDRHSGREPQRLHERHLADQHQRLFRARCSASRPASPGIAGRRPGTSTAALTRLMTNHTLKFGGEFRHNSDMLLQTQDAGGPRGKFTFNAAGPATRPRVRRSSGAGQRLCLVPARLAEQRAARSESVRRAGHEAHRRRSSFVHDKWQMRPNITVDLGLRWEYYSPLEGLAGEGSLANYDPATHTIRVRRLRRHRQLALNVKKNFKNFSPRTGISWRSERRHRSSARATARARFRSRITASPSTIPVKQNYTGTAANGSQAPARWPRASRRPRCSPSRQPASSRSRARCRTRRSMSFPRISMKARCTPGTSRSSDSCRSASRPTSRMSATAASTW